MYRGIRGSRVDKNNNLDGIFFIFKKNQFCVGKFKPLDFPGKGKKQMLEVRGRPRGRGEAPAKIRIYTEYRKYTRYSQSLFYFWNFPDIWCSKYWYFKFCIHVKHFSGNIFHEIDQTIRQPSDAGGQYIISLNTQTKWNELHFLEHKFCTTRAACDTWNEMNLKRTSLIMQSSVCVCEHLFLFCRV